MNHENRLLSAERIFDEVIPKKRALRTLLNLKLNGWQKWTLVGLIAFFLLTLVLAIAFSLTKQREVAYAAMISLLAMYVLFIGYQLTLIGPEVRKMLEAERTLLEHAVVQFSDDLKRARWIANSFDQITIEFAQQRLALLGDHLKHRISLMVGVIDKVGLVPLGVSAYLTLRKLEADKANLDFSIMEWAGWVLAFFYFVAMLLHQTAHGFQRHELVFKMALEMKQQDEIKRNEH